MREITEIREIQEIQIGALRHLKHICQKYSLTFYLSNGTLLGAIKYKKFIPWDDDIDIFMPREDYEKLVRLTEINTNIYELMNREHCAKWASTYSKLFDKRTLVQEGFADLGAEYGVSIDIFPLDNWQGGEKLARLQAAYGGLQCRFLCASCEQRFSTPKSGIQKGILYAIWRFSRFCGTKPFQKSLDRQVKKSRQNKETAYLGNVAWPLYGKREVIPAEVFSGTVEVEFEGEHYKAPVGYDRYLRSLYGDYEKELPPEQQKPHHHMKAWWRTEGNELEKRTDSAFQNNSI
ncbi:MAG: LicD family protein [Clostridia bacterium]|nr:LicD family protein [Clostridia bacterium]